MYGRICVYYDILTSDSLGGTVLELVKGEDEARGLLGGNLGREVSQYIGYSCLS